MKVFYNKKMQQINVADERFYTLDGENFFPSVTTVLEVYPKGKHFENWLKELGFNADMKLREAGDRGTKVHDTIEAYLKGREICFFNSDGRELYTRDEWKMFLRFVEFWERYNPEIIAIEEKLVSPKMQVGGTLDLVCRINGEVWYIDHKTSKAVYPTYYLQGAVYRAMWNLETKGPRINRIGVLHLNAFTRSNKDYQGKGWKIYEPDREFSELIKTYKHVRHIWDLENPDYRPFTETYPAKISINQRVFHNESN